MKLDIGGGNNPKTGFINLDMLSSADITHDLNQLPWPIADDSVDQVYTSHCIEHIANLFDFIREIGRICKRGASVEIRCPDPLSEMAMCPGHTHTISPTQMRHICIEFIDVFWHDHPKRFRLDSVIAVPDHKYFAEARANPLFAAWSDMNIMTFLARTRHENQFLLTVVDNKT